MSDENHSPGPRRWVIDDLVSSLRADVRDLLYENAELVEALREVLDFTELPARWPGCAYPDCNGCKARAAHDKASALLARIDARTAQEKP